MRRVLTASIMLSGESSTRTRISFADSDDHMHHHPCRAFGSDKTIKVLLESQGSSPHLSFVSIVLLIKFQVQIFPQEDRKRRQPRTDLIFLDIRAACGTGACVEKRRAVAR